MSARFVSSDGVTLVDVIRLAWPDGRTSERFRVRRFGFMVGMARAVAELSRLVDMSDLSESPLSRGALCGLLLMS